MQLPADSLLILCIFFFLIASVFCSVGFGGGSTYLALMLIWDIPYYIWSNALICNLVVVSGSTYILFKEKFINFKKFLPFVLSSIPMTFIGALFKLDENIFFILPNFTLILASIFLMHKGIRNQKHDFKSLSYPKHVSLIIGSSIGLLSGLVGIGGGVFLAPILNFMKWDKPIKIASLSAFFIFVNSISGLSRTTLATLQTDLRSSLCLIFAVFLTRIKIRFSIKMFSSKVIIIVTALLIMFVGLKMLI